MALLEIHKRKTGALIQVSVEAAAVLCGATPEQQKALAEYGENLGLAFQLADDLQDFHSDRPEKVNFATALGIDETRRAPAHGQRRGNGVLIYFSRKCGSLAPNGANERPTGVKRLDVTLVELGLAPRAAKPRV